MLDILKAYAAKKPEDAESKENLSKNGNNIYGK